MRIRISVLFLIIFGYCLVSCNSNTTSDLPATKENFIPEIKIDTNLFTTHFKQDSFADLTLLNYFYQKNDCNPYWFSQNNQKQFNQVKQLIDSSAYHGLNSSKYDIEKIEKLFPHSIDTSFISQNREPDSIIVLDILFSNSFIKLMKDLYSGAIHPQTADSNWFHSNNQLSVELFDSILICLNDENWNAFESILKINLKEYTLLQNELLTLKNIYHHQGWNLVDYGESLEFEDVDPRIVSIRKRLDKQEFLLNDNDSSLIYDEDLELAVINFQYKYNLVADGVIGKATVDAMNVSVRKRLESVVSSLERLRWLPKQFPSNYILANIPAFELVYYKNDTVAYESKIIVGRINRQTPSFSDTMTYVELNPFWTIPPTILEEDVIPKLLKDSSYLKKKKIRVLTHSGKELNADSIDWAEINPKRVPYKLKKDPGPYNDLGRVKFMFPNSHMVYFHDTPSRYLFASNVAAHSSGCIRIQHPFDFARALFHESEVWGNDTIITEIKKGENKKISLPEAIPVFIIYQTVWKDKREEIRFGKDVYKKDKQIYTLLKYDIESIKTGLGKIVEPDSVLVQ